MTSKAGLIERGRAAALKHLFIDTCTIEDQPTSTDAVTGVITEESPSLLYSGGCRLVPQSATDVGIGTAEIKSYLYELQIPVSVTGVEPGHVVTMTSVTDGDLTGLEMSVLEVPFASSFSMIRKLVVRRL